MSDEIQTTRRPALRLDVACNDPDNGLFAHIAEHLQVTTWDGENIELECQRMRAPRFTEVSGGIRFMRHVWPTLASKEWYGNNWCWNAYWLAPEDLISLLRCAQVSGMFHCGCAPTQLYENWNNGPFNVDLWTANLWGRHSIGVADAA